MEGLSTVGAAAVAATARVPALASPGEAARPVALGPSLAGVAEVDWELIKGPKAGPEDA